MRRTPLFLLLGLVLSFWPHDAARAGGGERKVGNRSRTEWLKILQADKREKARRAAIIALEVYGPKADQVLEGLTQALEKDASPQIRREVAACLGRMGADAKVTIPALTTALTDDKDGGVRESAARALGALAPHSRTAVEELAKALQDPYPSARTAAVLALKELGEDAKLVLPQIVEFLQGAKVKDSEPLARAHAAQLVANLGGGAEAVAALTEVVGDSGAPPQLRGAVADALGRFEVKAESAAGKLGEVVGDVKSDLVLRQKALVALGKVSTDAKLVWPAA